MALAPRLWRSLPNLDLTPADRKVLATLERAARLAKSPTFQSGLEDIAAAAEVSKRTVQRSILRLIEVGLVKKTTSDEWNRHIPNTYELVRNWRNRQHDAVHPVRQATGLTPLDYPGSKSWLVPTIASWITENRHKTFVEGFAGGASIGLAIAHLKLADEVVLVEKDPDVAAFWTTVISDKGGIDYLIDQCERLPVDEQAIQAWLVRPLSNRRERGFHRLLQSVFLFNGITRADNAKLLCRGRMYRWNPTRIMMRLWFIKRLRERIRFVEGDALDYMRANHRSRDTAWYLDTPYPSYRVGKDCLYQTPAVSTRALFAATSKLKGSWIMSNEDSWMIREQCDAHGLDYRRPIVRSNHGVKAKKVELLIGRDLSGLNLQPYKAFVGEAKSAEEDAA